MNATKITSLLLLILTVGGCASFEEVRDYADESAKLTAYTELATRFRDTYDRERFYLPDGTVEEARGNDKKRTAIYDDLLKIQHVTSLYLRTLAALAGEELPNPSKALSSLESAIGAHPELGIDKKHMEAVSGITKLVTKWLAASRRQDAVREMIKEGNAPLQTMLEGMTTLVRYYRKTNENEKKMVLGFLETELLYADAPEDRLLATLARVHMESKKREYEKFQPKYDALEKGLEAVAKGHENLFENIDRLTSDEVKSTIYGFTHDIKSIRERLQAVHD